MTELQAIAEHIGRVTGEPFRPDATVRLSGGCINHTVRLSDGRRQFFVKLNAHGFLPMFEAEAAGLRELAATRTLRVPEPLVTGVTETQAYLVMEFIALGRTGDHALAGQQLAALHRTLGARFGWWRDNTLGTTLQPNEPSDVWATFWRAHRLGFQLELAARNGYRGRLQSQGGRLLERFGALLTHQPSPSLVHGDLWGGNLGFDVRGHPVIFDPAVYYGDREADLAMTELFGGFPSAFYDAYRATWPLDPGYRVRKTLYNLYHVLNHLNLFGDGYLAQAQDMIDRLLAEVG